MKSIADATSLGDGIDRIPERLRDNYPDIKDEQFWKYYERCKTMSMLNITGFNNIHRSMKYIKENKVPGDLVECGCFLGGASIFISLLRDAFGLGSKTLWVFDSFKGFPHGESDALFCNGHPMDAIQYVSFREAVEGNFAAAHPDCKNLRFVEGFVEDTIPRCSIGAISLLRLDTDFYGSTLTELEGLYDRLVRGGVLIIDDYGLFDGSRRATDEFLSRLQSPPLLNRIDMSVWAGVKP